MFTWAINCVNKGYLFPGKHLKTMQCKGMVLVEWDPSCAFRNLFYFDVIFLNEWKGQSNCCSKIHLSSYLGNIGSTLRVQVCGTVVPTWPIQGLLTTCLEPGPCCCALVLLVVFKNYIQQALFSTAISSPNKILSAGAQIIYQSVRLSNQEPAIIQLIA